MFKFFKKKSEEDPYLKMMNQNLAELREINRQLTERSRLLDERIAKAEDILRQDGYTDEDLERIRQKSKFKLVK